MCALSFRFQSMINRLRSVIQQQDYGSMRLLLADYTAPEIADSFDLFDQKEQLQILRNIEIDLAVEIFSCLPDDVQLELMGEFREERAVKFLEEMEPDDRTDLMQSMPEEVAQKLFEKLPEEEREEVEELSKYEETSAGGIMTTDFVHLPIDINVNEAIDIIRRDFRQIRMSWDIYLLSDDERLEGTVSLHTLLLSKSDNKVEEIMTPNPIAMTHDTDQEEVARTMLQFNFLAIPVVDFKNRMLGVVTLDDIAEVIEEEATEDQELFGAVLASDEAYNRAGTWSLMKQRLPWLAILLVLSSLVGFIIEYYSHNKFFNFTTFTILVAFFPMITATAGNAGTQAATIIVRGIATGEIDYRNFMIVLRNEFFVGLSMGIILAILAFIRVVFFEMNKTGVIISIITAISILLILIFSTLIGGLLPIFVRRMGFDPATMSSPLLTTAIDILAALTYFNIALALSSFG